MKPTKFLIIITSLSVLLIILGLFLPWMFGDPTGKSTQTQVGNNIEINIELQKISGWQVLFTGLAPACIASTFGPKWTILPMLLPVAAILTFVLVLFPWRKRKVLKRDGFVLLGMALLTMISLNNGKPICPAEITSHWTYINGPGTLGNFMEVFAFLFMLISAGVIIIKRFPKPVSEIPPLPVEYRMCLKCMTSVDKREKVCPNCSNRME
jgi:hypothetical protein